MPQSRSASYSRRTRTPRSGSSTPPKPRPAPPTKRIIAKPAPVSPVALPRPLSVPVEDRPGPREQAIALTLLLAVFLLLHLLWEQFAIRGPGTLFGYEDTWLLERFLLWWPILFVAAYVGLCLPRPVAASIRWGVLLGYVALLILTILPSYSPPATNPGCGAHWAKIECLPDVAFPMLLRFAPIPTMLFLFSGTARRWSASRAAGLGLMFFSLWRSLYGSVPDLLVIAGGGGMRSAVPAVQWYYEFFIDYFWHLVYPLLGLLLFFHRIPGLHTRFRWGENLSTMLRPFGAWIRRSVTVDLAWGCALFIVVLVAYIVLLLLLAGGPTEGVGDDSAVFTRILFDQVFLLAIIAGVGEELVFRGILQGTLHRILGPGFWNAAAAVTIQGLAFGAVHAGYQDLDHLLFPLLFGIFIGAVYRLFGILAAILVHVEIDVLAFAQSYWTQGTESAGAIVLGLLVWTMLVVNIVFPLLVGLLYLFRRRDERRNRAIAP